MTLQTYNTIELRYADTELAKHRFVKEETYELSRRFARKMMSKTIDKVLENTELKVELIELKEELEILRAERSHWHHMYNQEVDNGHCTDTN